MKETDEARSSWPAGVRRAHEDDPLVLAQLRRIEVLDGDLAVMKLLGVTKRDRKKKEQARDDAVEVLREIITELDNPLGTVASSGRRRY